MLILLFCVAFTLPSAFASKPLTLSNGEIVSAAEVTFLEQCSAIKITEDVTWSLAYANCLGRVRGIVDGHALTMVASKAQPWWCVPHKVSDGEVYHAVLSWATKYPREVANINKQSKTQIEAATVVTLRALIQAYPCKII